MRRSILIIMSLTVWAAAMPSANAALWTGSCILGLKLDFTSPVRMTGTAPSYTITMEPTIDLDPTVSGVQPCVVTLDADQVSRSTSISASGSSTMWSCSSTLASGSWNQSWTDRHGFANPPTLFGSHTMTGTWNDWILGIDNAELSVLGVAHLSVQQQEHGKLADCAGGGFRTLRLNGVLVFQDP